MKVNFLATLPGIATVFLPKCSMCFAAYAGVLSAMGIGFSDYTQYLLPFTLIFLTISLFALFYRAKHRWGYKPFVIGASASIIILLGKFQFESQVITYAGLGILLAASLWNSWPKRRTNPYTLDSTLCCKD